MNVEVLLGFITLSVCYFFMGYIIGYCWRMIKE